MSLESIRFDKVQGSLQILNQLLLPEHTVYEPVNDVEDAWKAIREMKVRIMQYNVQSFVDCCLLVVVN